MFSSQSQTQYTFVHDVLLEALFCGKTTIPTSEIANAWKAVEAAINGEDNHIVGQLKVKTRGACFSISRCD